jgi:hypothetical protein
MKNSVVGALARGQASFLGCLAICFGLVPSYLHSEGGVSNYGTLRRTVVFYSLAFGLADFFTGSAAYRLHQQRKTALASWLYVLAGLLVAVLLSTYPYKLNGAFRLVHELVGINLFIFETSFSAWLCLGLARSWQHLLMLLVFVVGAFISFITLLGLTHLLFVGQAITAVAFAVLLISCAHSVVAAPKTLLET